MPICAAFSNSSSMRAAPSSMEYSVCTCRWTKLLSEAGWDDIGDESMPEERQFLYAAPSPQVPCWARGELAADSIQGGLQILGGKGCGSRRVRRCQGVRT